MVKRLRGKEKKLNRLDHMRCPGCNKIISYKDITVIRFKENLFVVAHFSNNCNCMWEYKRLEE